jgi:N-acylneuraminate cytidylyltransferase
MIQYAIDAAQAITSTVVVSSDSEEIGRYAMDRGCAWHIRDERLCADDVPMVDVLLDVLEHQINPYDVVVMIYPCAPFVYVDDIRIGLKWVKHHRVVYPVYRSHEQPERALLVHDGKVSPRFPEYKDINSDIFPQSYHSAGQWYVVDPAWLRLAKTLTPMEAGYVEIPASRAIDIDTPDDWEMAELMYERLL